MRYAVLILFLMLGTVVGFVLPYFLQDRFGGMGITTPASKHELSWTTVLWFLRILGMGFGLAAVLYFALSKHDLEH